MATTLLPPTSLGARRTAASRRSRVDVLNPIADFVPSPARIRTPTAAMIGAALLGRRSPPMASLVFAAQQHLGQHEPELGRRQRSPPVHRSEHDPIRRHWHGLAREVFPEHDVHDGQPALEANRSDRQLRFRTASPGGLVPADYSVRRTGQIQAFSTETYTFQIDTTDAVKLIVNGTTVIDQSGYQGGAGVAPSTFTGTIAMTAGAKVPIQLDQADTSNESVDQALVEQPERSADAGAGGTALPERRHARPGRELLREPNLHRARRAAAARPDVYADWGTGNPATETRVADRQFQHVSGKAARVARTPAT